MDMFEKIKTHIIERMGQYTDSRQPTGDEVRIAWLVDEVERLQKDKKGNTKLICVGCKDEFDNPDDIYCSDCRYA